MKLKRAQNGFERVLKKAIVASVALLLVFFVILNYASVEEYMISSLRRLWGILNAPKPDFEMSATPEFVTLQSSGGSQNRTVITVKSLDGFSGNVTFKIEHSGIVGDIQFIFGRSKVNLPSGAQIQCTLTLSVLTVVSPGTYHIDITGTADNSEQHSTRVTLTVFA